MDNINHSCKLLITNNSSWDLPMISMEPQQQQHNFINFHDQYQHQHQHQNIIIPTKNDNPQNPLLFPINHSLHDLRAVLAPVAAAAAAEEEEEEAEEEEEEDEAEELGAMKEMMYKMAAMQPVDIDPATIRKPKRRNVRISDDPQSVAARRRRERISERIRILQRLVPGGTKMDTASMLDEAIRYVKFLKRQIRLLNKPSNFTNIHNNNNNNTNNYSLLASSSSSLDHNINWGAFDNYKLLLADQYNVHSHGKSSTTSGGSAAAGGFFAAGRGGRY